MIRGHTVAPFGALFLVCVSVPLSSCLSPGPGSKTPVSPPGSEEPSERGASDFDWQLPPDFPKPTVPVDNPMTRAKVELGRQLFYDRRLSDDGTIACATCHRQELAFTDSLARAVGATGEFHPRSAMSLANVAYSVSLTWADPSLVRLEAQAMIPLFNEDPVEMGLTDRGEEVLDRLRTDPVYREMFRDAYPGQGDPIDIDNITRAIAAFERTLISGRSPYDRLLYDDEDAMSESALRGMRLFFSERLLCSQCHGGFTFSGPVIFEGSGPTAPVFHNTGLYNIDGTGDYPPDDPGLYTITEAQEDMGRFRAPTLRNIALTAPYMHDGSIGTLAGVIEHYARGGRTITSGPYAGTGRDNRWKSKRVAGFDLSKSDRDDLVSFLESLTDGAFITDPRHADPFRLTGEGERSYQGGQEVK